MSSRIEEFENDVIISGMAGIFPNSDNVRHFEDNLRSKVDMTSNCDRRWATPDSKLPKRLGFLTDNKLNKFDANFFNILPHAANVMDPMGRILFEKTYEAIIDAGYNPEEIRGTKTAVYIGACFSDTEVSNFTTKIAGYFGVPSSFRSLLANRISSWLDIHGPSYVVDTACSSSMYALEHAFDGIKSGKCESAIVGGCAICLHKNMAISFGQVGFLSKDGRCKCFDETADGYTKAEAIAVLFLQKRQNARRLYAQVVHTKTNCDGFQPGGLFHPSEAQQTVLLEEFYEECSVDPRDLQFFEVHATGTKVGEPIEMKAVTDAILSKRQEPPRVGTVKSNMGHSESASTICSIVKVILSYECGYILPNINLQKLRTDIDALNDGTALVVTEPTPWNGGLTGVNSFGFGGANGHVLLNSNSKIKITNGRVEDDLPKLVLVSGRTEEAVDVMLQDLENRPLDDEYVALFHEINKRTIPRHLYRGYSILQKQNGEQVRDITPFLEVEKPVWFVYTGVGSQWNTMGESLLKIPVINESIKKCHEVLMSKGVDLIKILTTKDPSVFENILNSYCGIVAIQIALTDFMKTISIEPVGIIGHSVGEFGCAYADGCLTFEQTILLAYYRGIASNQSKSKPGIMLSIGMGAKEVTTLLPTSIDIACHNSPDNCTISGLKDDVAILIPILKKNGTFHKVVESSNLALHSRHIQEVGKRFLNETKNLISTPKKRSGKWFSSSYKEADWIQEVSQYASAEYFQQNIVGTVYFEEVCTHVPKNALVVEIAPHGLLQAILRRSLSKDVVNIPLLHKKEENNLFYLLAAIGKIYEAGANPQISKIYSPIDFPVSKGTPSISSLVRWDHERDWFVHEDDEEFKLKQGQRTVSISPKEDEYKYLTGHVINGINLYPASGFLVLAWETLSLMNGKRMNEMPVTINDVRFLRYTAISETEPTRFNISIFKNSGDFEISECGELVVKGKIFELEENEESDFEEIEDSECDQIKRDDFYHVFNVRDHTYSGQFRAVTSVNYSVTKGKIAWHDNYVTFMDSALQIMIIINFGWESETSVPVSLKKVIINPRKHQRILKSLNKENPDKE